MILTDERWRELLHTRATNPGAVRQAYATRKRRPQLLSDQGTLFLVAADHPARGAPDRRALLERLLVALENPAVDGVVGTPDIVEELLPLGGMPSDRMSWHGVVRGLVMGSPLLHPPSGSTRTAVEAAAKALEAAK